MERPAGGDSGGVSTSTVTVGAARCTLPSTVRGERQLPHGRNVRRHVHPSRRPARAATGFRVLRSHELPAQGMIRLTGKSGSSTRFEITNDGWESGRRTRRRASNGSRPRYGGCSILRRVSGRTRQRSLVGRRPRQCCGRTATASTVTEVGHVCREAMQALAAAFCAEQGQAVTAGRSNTVDRIRAGLNTRYTGGCRRRAPRSMKRVLAYRGTVSDLVQRLEHGAEEGGRVDRLGTMRGLVVTQTAWNLR